MKINFRSQLFLVFILLITLALGVTLVAVVNATNKNIRIKAGEELDTAQQVLALLMEENKNTLTQKADVLAKDFAFRDAVATQEEETIVSVLENHGDRINADMMLLLDEQGVPIVGSHEIAPRVLSEIKLKLIEEQETFSLFVVAEHVAFQTVIVPIKAPEIISWAVLGFRIDQVLAKKFKSITHTDVIFLYQEAPDKPSNIIFTTGIHLRSVFNPSLNTLENSYKIKNYLDEHNWLTREAITLSSDIQRLNALMAISMNATLEAYIPLKLQMLLVALLTLVIAVGVTFLIAKKVTRPIDALVLAAKRIAKGNYEQQLDLNEKNEFGLLGTAINQMQHAIFERENQIKYQAENDLVTHLPNQHTISQFLSIELTNTETTSLLGILNIDNYEQVVDIYGMTWCNKMLALIAQNLSNIMPKNSRIARIGDSEFLLYYKHKDKQALEGIVRNLCESLSSNVVVADINFTVEYSMGFVEYPKQGKTLKELMRRAHIALNTCQDQNSIYQIYQEGQDEKLLRQVKITQALQKAIKLGDFRLCYQPKLNLKTNRVCQVEALIRWETCEHGPVYPDEFIELAEQSGDITKISHWVIDTVIKQLIAWRSMHPDIVISINLSTRDILDEAFLVETFDKIEKNKIDPNRLMFEITESAMMSNPTQSIQNLERIHNKGIGLSMDDFGTGFSSLSQLKLMPIHELKIDKSFVMKMDTNPDDQMIVKLATQLGHHLGLSVVVEGVENEATLELLKQMGCDAVQGYFISKPLYLADLETWLLTVQLNNVLPIKGKGNES